MSRSSSHPQPQQQVVHVHHHVDYRSKAEDRRRELEDLQQKRLAKTKAARLKDASAVPITDACNFLENMTRNRMVRRKNQADAIQFLHQYRGSDETTTTTTTTTSSSRYSLSPTKQYSRPDACASIYSYDVYPIYNNNTIAVTNKRDNDDDNDMSLQLPPVIDKNSICFESAFKALGIIVKEASQVPLPDDDDDDDDDNDNDDKQNNNNINIDTLLLSFAEEAARVPLPDDDDNDKDKDRHRNNSILIIEGEEEEKEAQQHDVTPFHNHNKSNIDKVDINNSLATTTPSSSLIPFESFLKLGESLSDDGSIDSIIPGGSFRSLGASMMMANDNDNDIDPSNKDGSKDKKEDNNNVDSRILLRKQAKQLREEKSGFKASLPLPVVYSQSNMTHFLTNKEEDDDDDISTIEGSKCLSLYTDINTEEEQIDDGTNVLLGPLPCSIPVKLDSYSIMTEREEDLRGRSNNNSEIVSQVPRVNSSKTENGLNTFDNAIAERFKPIYDDTSKEYTTISATGDSTIIEGSNDVTKVQVGINIEDESCPETCFSEKKNQEQSVDITESFENKTPKKSNLTIAISDDNIESISTSISTSENEKLQEAQSIQNDDRSTNLLARMDATISDDNKDSNPTNISASDNEKLQEAQSIQNHDPVTTTSIAHVDARPRQPRRNRNRRKKKDDGYYPSSSLFVSRQFLSR
jgi:hypothetical protein